MVAIVFALSLGTNQIASATPPEETLSRANQMVEEFNQARVELKSEQSSVRTAAWERLSSMYQELQANADLENVTDESQAALIQYRLTSLSNFLNDWQYVTSL